MRNLARKHFYKKGKQTSIQFNELHAHLNITNILAYKYNTKENIAFIQITATTTSIGNFASRTF